MKGLFDQIQTARLVLRRVVEADLEQVVSVEADPATNAFRPGGAPSQAECRDELRAYLRVWDATGLGYWVVERDRTVVGLAGIRPMRLRDRECWNLYYRFKPAAWGRGYATEAASAAVRAAAAVAAEHPIVARTRPDNEPSRRVAERVGLVYNPGLDGDGYVVFTPLVGERKAGTPRRHTGAGTCVTDARCPYRSAAMCGCPPRAGSRR